MNSCTLTSMSNDVILRIAGDKQAFKTIETLGCLIQLNKDFYERMGKFIKDSKLIDFLKAISENNTKDAYKALKRRYPNLTHLKFDDFIKWAEYSNIKPSIIHLCTKNYYTNNCIFKNSSGDYEIWQILKEENKLASLDLKTQKQTILELGVNSLSNKFCIAISDSCIAISSRPQIGSEIAIFDKINGKCLKFISHSNEITHLEYKDNYLYVLCNDENDKRKLLRYDCNNWEALPKEFHIPRDVRSFYIISDTLLFVSTNRLYAVSNDNYLSNNQIFYKSAWCQEIHPRIQIDDGIIYSLIKDKEKVLVMRHCINDPDNDSNDFDIDSKILLTLSLDLADIYHFYIQHNKVFIITKDKIKCYDFFKNCLIEEFPCCKEGSPSTTLFKSDQKISAILNDSLLTLDYTKSQ